MKTFDYILKKSFGGLLAVVLGCVLGNPVHAQSYWNGGSGNWSSTNGWVASPPTTNAPAYVSPPDSATASADVISTNSVVSVNGSYKVGALTVGSTDTVAINDGQSLTVTSSGGITNAGVVTNAGNIKVESTGDLTQLLVYGNVSLQGGGTVTLANNYASISGSSGSVLTNVNNTIQGVGSISYGVIGFVNDANGVVNANLAGETLGIFAPGTVQNAGTLEASNGGTLAIGNQYFSASLVSTGGTIQALTGSTVDLGAQTQISGTSILAQNGATIALSQSFNGQLGTSVISNSTLTTIGTGQIVNSGNANLSNVTNSGTFVATDGSSTTLSGTMINSGNIEVNGSGDYTPISVSGSVTLSGGGTVTLNLGNLGGSAGSGNNLTNIDNTIQGTGGVGSSTFTNEANGTIDANVSGGLLYVVPSTLQNSGTLEASNGGKLLLGGQLAPGVFVFPSFSSTGGTIEALTNSTVELGNQSNIFGTAILAQNGATVALNQNFNGELGNALIGNSTLSTTGTGQIVNAGIANLYNVTNSGTLVGTDGSSTSLSGPIINSGNITLNSTGDATTLVVVGSTTLSGGGTVKLNGGTLVGAAYYQNSPANSLDNIDNTIEGGGPVSNTPPSGYFTTLTNETGGTINANLSGQTLAIAATTVNNSGTLEASNGGTLQLGGQYVPTYLNSTGGTIQALTGSTVELGQQSDIFGTTILAQNGATVALNQNFNGELGNALIGNSTLSTTGTGQIVNAGIANLYNVTNSGTLVGTDGSSTSLSGPIINSGNITLNSTGDATTLVVVGSTTLSGGGTVKLNGGTLVGAAYYQNSPANSLDNIDNTIEGGAPASNTPSSGYFGTLTNETGGTINANLSGQTLAIAATTVNNTGTLEASNGGTLQLGGQYVPTYLNSTGGTIQALTGSTVELGQQSDIFGTTILAQNGATVALNQNFNGELGNALIGNSTLSTTGTGQIVNAGIANLYNVTNSGALVGTDGSSTSLSGPIINSGNITLNSTGDATTLVVVGSTTLSGGGTVKLNGGTLVGAAYYQNSPANSLDNIDNTIEGGGPVSNTPPSGYFTTLTNETGGTINANLSGQTLAIAATTVNNTGTLEASNGGTLQLGSQYLPTYVNSTGGTIQALAGSTIALNGSITLTGGTLNLNGGTLRAMASSTDYISGSAPGSVNLASGGGTIDNNGNTFTIAAPIGGSGALTSIGAGTTILTGNNNYTGTTTISAGTLQIGNGGSTGNIGGGIITDNGSLVYDLTTNTILSNSITGDGTISDIGSGTLSLTGNISNFTGTIEIGITTGTGSNGPTGIVSLTNTTNSGTFVANDGSITTLGGAIVNSGSISINSTGDPTVLFISGNVTLSGGGTVSLSGGAFLIGASTVPTGGNNLTNVDNTIQGGILDGESISYPIGSPYMGNDLNTFTNETNGVVDANIAGATFAMGGATTVNNSGTLEASNGGTLAIGNQYFSASLTSTGGTIQALTGSTVDLGAQTQISGTSIMAQNGATVALSQNFNGQLGTSVISNSTLTTNGTGQIVNSGNASLSNVTISGNIANSGSISVDATGGNTGLTLDGNTTLSGGGTVSLDGAVSVNSYYSGNNFTNYTLTNIDNTIQGGGGAQSGPAFVNVNVTNEANGTINANVSGQTLALYGTVTNSGTLEASNGGTLQLQNVEPDFSNPHPTGAIEALTGSTVELTGGAIISGTNLSTAGTGQIVNTGYASLIGGSNSGTFLSAGTNNPQTSLGLDGQTDGALTNSGTITATDNKTGTLTGSIINSGSITFNTTNTYTNISLQGNTTLSGGGTVSLDGAVSVNSYYSGNNFTNYTLTNIDNTIQGGGGAQSGPAFVNVNVTNEANGTINANVSGQTLALYGTVTNSGTLEASNGGTLQLQNVEPDFSNPHPTGAIEALTGSTVELTGGAIISGTNLSTAGTGQIVNTGYASLIGGSNSGTFLSAGTNNPQTSLGLDGQTDGALTNSGTITATDNKTGTLTGSIINSGSITFNTTNTYTNISLQGNTTLSGGGTVSLDGAVSVNSYYSGNNFTNYTLTNVDNTIQGGGGAQSGPAFVNVNVTNEANGTINANVSGQTLALYGTVTNSGTLEASNGGTLQLQNVEPDFSNPHPTGAIEALTGSTVELTGGAIISGTNLSTAGTGQIVNTGYASLIGGSNSGTFLSAGTNNPQTSLGLDGQTDGALTNSGTITATDNKTGTLTGSIINSGSITFNTTNTYTNISLQGNTTLSGGGTVSLDGAVSVNSYYSGNNFTNYTLTNIDNTIQGGGGAQSGPAFVNVNVTNEANGTINANVSGQTLALYGTVTNSGTLEASNGGTLQIQNLESGSNNSSGTIVALSSSTIELNGNVALTGGGTINLNGGTLRAMGNLNVLASGLNSSNVTLASGGGTIDNNGNSIIIAAPVGGSGALTSIGTGTLILTGNNNYSGSTTISAGTLQIGNSGSTGNIGSGTITDNASLVYDLTTNTILGNTINGDGTITNIGSGTLSLTGNTSNFTGSIDITSGSVSVASVGQLGSGPVSLGNGSSLQYTGGSATVTQGIVVTNGTGVISNTGNGVLTLAGGVDKNGSVLNLTGNIVITGPITGGDPHSDVVLGGNDAGATVGLTTADSYNGPTTISSGSTLLTGVSGALPTSTPTDVTLGGGALDTSSTTNTLDLLGTSQTVDSLTSTGPSTNQVISSNGTASGTPAIGASPSNTSPTSAIGELTVNTSNYTSNGGVDTFSGTLGGSSGLNTFGLTKSGAGTLVLTGANTYSGGTAVTGGTLYANGGVAGTSSATGSGAITVAGGAALGGSGVIRPGSGNGITLAANSTLISGGVQATASPTTTAGAGLTLDNTVAQATILDASVGTANLTFYLGAGNPTSAGVYTFNNPNIASTYLTVLGNTMGEIKFAAGDTITLTDLTTGNLQLNLSVPYLLIEAGTTPDELIDNNLYSGLATSGGVLDGIIQNGWVTTPITIAGNVTGEYPSERLYLDNGMLEVVPEPGTWAMMLGGLAVLVLYRHRRKV